MGSRGKEVVQTVREEELTGREALSVSLWARHPPLTHIRPMDHRWTTVRRKSVVCRRCEGIFHGNIRFQEPTWKNSTISRVSDAEQI